MGTVAQPINLVHARIRLKALVTSHQSIPGEESRSRGKGAVMVDAGTQGTFDYVRIERSDMNLSAVR